MPAILPTDCRFCLSGPWRLQQSLCVFPCASRGPADFRGRVADSTVDQVLAPTTAAQRLLDLLLQQPRQAERAAMLPGCFEAPALGDLAQVSTAALRGRTRHGCQHPS